MDFRMSCLYCEYVVDVSQKQWQRHIRTATHRKAMDQKSNKPKKCPICYKKMMSSPWNSKQHIIKCKSTNKNQYCNICWVDDITYNEMLDHVQTYEHKEKMKSIKPWDNIQFDFIEYDDNGECL